MSTRDLKIRLIMEGQDKLSNKLGNIFNASKRLKTQIGELRNTQRGLEGALARSEVFEKQSATVTSYREKLAAANTTLEQRRNALAATDKPNQKMVQGLLAAERMASKASESLKREESALEQVKGEMTRAGIAADNLGRQQAELKARIDKTKASLDQLTIKAKSAGKLAALDIGMTKSAENGMRSGAMQIAAATAAAMPLLRMARNAGNFQSGMVDLQQTAGLSDKETAALAATIRGAARDTIQPITNVQAALQSLVAQGMDPRIATGMLRPIGTMATTYKLQVEDAAKASFAAYDNLKVPISEAGKAMEIMVAAGKAGKVEVADMARALPSLTGSAQVLGMSGLKAVAQLGAALQIAGKTANGADEATNNVNNLLNKIGDNETLKKFASFGIDAKASYAAGARAGASQLETLIVLLDRVQAKGGTVNDVFGDMQARAAAAALLANKDEFKKIATQAAGSKGMIQQDLTTRIKNDPLVKQEELMNRLGDAGLTIGTHLLPPLVRLAELAATATEKVAGLANRFPGLASFIGSALVYLVAAGGTIGAMRLAFSAATYPVVGLIRAFRMVSSAMDWVKGFQAAGGILRFLGPVVTTLATNFFRLLSVGRLFLLANPFAAIVFGVSLAVLAIYNHWDRLKAMFLGAVDWFKAIGARIIDGLSNGFTNTFERLSAKFAAVPEKLKNTFRKALGIHSPSRVFASYGDHLMAGLANGINGGAGGPVARIGRLSRDLTAALAVGAGVASPAAGGGPEGGIGGGMAGGQLVQNVTINVTQAPGQSGQDLARLIANELDRRQRDAAAARRSAFRDYGE